VDMLPAEVPIELQPPEGDQHWTAKASARSTLDDFFRRTGRKVYISSELAVFYPGEPRFSPDLLAVLDVELRPRTKWVVPDEGKGLDLVIEVHYAGDRAKDFEVNVERYARLGIAEYFIFDRGDLSLEGHRLRRTAGGAAARTYAPILAQGGRYASQVLGLDLVVDGSTLRFFAGSAPLLEASELVVKLGGMLDEVLAHKREAEEARREAEAARQKAEEARQQAEEARQKAEARAAAAEAEVARLKRGR
jgi:Uma2 family endonuclease